MTHDPFSEKFQQLSKKNYQAIYLFEQSKYELLKFSQSSQKALSFTCCLDILLDEEGKKYESLDNSEGDLC